MCEHNHKNCEIHFRINILFAEPRVGKWAEEAEKERNSRAVGTANTFILSQWHSSSSSRHTIFFLWWLTQRSQPLTQPHHHILAVHNTTQHSFRTFPGGSYICLHNKSCLCGSTLAWHVWGTVRYMWKSLSPVRLLWSPTVLLNEFSRQNTGVRSHFLLRVSSKPRELF